VPARYADEPDRLPRVPEFERLRGRVSKVRSAGAAMSEPTVRGSAPLAVEQDGRVRWLKLGGLLDGSLTYEEDEKLEALYMAAQQLKAPFPFFGGKSKIAAAVWQRFGRVDNYVECFFGSGAVLLSCPHPGHTETVNDADGLLANFWRALQHDPDGVAAAADWPVNEADLHARHRWLVDRRSMVEALMADPDWYDAQAAGWWVWGISQWIGTGWCPPAGGGPDWGV
jgi:DNA adenine methylase